MSAKEIDYWARHNGEVDAFPATEDQHGGLSKREYFALHLTAALIAAGKMKEVATTDGVAAADLLLEKLAEDG